MRDTSHLEQKILNLADHCVKCGLCSSHCPTYRLKQDENESPRGRIALSQGLASGAIKADGKAVFHLNNCLHCMRCESVCPSEVSYEALIHATNELLNLKSGQNSPIQTKISQFLSQLTHQNWQTITRIYHFISRMGLLQVLRLNKAGRRLLNYFPTRHNSLKTLQTTTDQAHSKNTIYLFTGCISHIFANKTLQTSIALLKHCGYAVKVPVKQTCCGAIAMRQGLTDIDQQCQSDNQLAFRDKNNSPIVFFTTGCGTKLKNYQEWLPAKTSFANRVIDITPFLNKSKLFATLTFSPLKKTVLIYNPCSERNILKQSTATEKLLSRIPDIKLVHLDKSTGCCGASGSHLFTHPQQADLIRDPIIEQVLRLSPNIIVSPNYPCNMHIQAGLKEKGLDIPIMHPIELLHKLIILENV